MAGLSWLNDTQWAAIEPLLPQSVNLNGSV
ncbi:hypothetical protein ACIDI_10c00020 [Acidiphilium sp. JA12-A1]|nr:hypothetical protein ACIDI_10c00020 [Acidiphilium sp. JA12-A1]